MIVPARAPPRGSREEVLCRSTRNGQIRWLWRQDRRERGDTYLTRANTERKIRDAAARAEASGRFNGEGRKTDKVSLLEKESCVTGTLAHLIEGHHELVRWRFRRGHGDGQKEAPVRAQPSEVRPALPLRSRRHLGRQVPSRPSRPLRIWPPLPVCGFRLKASRELHSVKLF